MESTHRRHGEVPRNDRFLLALTMTLVGVGWALRLRQYHFGRSLWLDEAMLAVNIVSRSPGELLRPLDFNQNAPPLFLLAMKAATVLFGISELALRLVPQLAGWFVVAGMAVALWRSLGVVGAFLGASLSALSPALIRFANEAKPYGVDAAVTVLLLLLILDREAEFTARRWVALGAAGWAGVWLSHPAVFVAAAVWAGLLLRFHARRRQFVRVLFVGAVWAAAFLISYASFGRRDAGNERVRAGYSTAFLPPSVESADRLPLMISGTILPSFQGDGTTAPGISTRESAALLFLLAICASAAIASLGGWIAIPLVGPLVLAYLAACLGLYPVGVPRLMVFGYPCILVSASFLGALAFQRLGPRAGRLAAVLWLLALWPSWTLSARSWSAPFRGDDFRGAYSEYSSLQLGEPVYVSARALPAWLFYSTNWSAGSRRQRELFENRLRFYAAAANHGPSFENAASRGRPVLIGEGSDLVFDLRGRLEILGIATGRQWRWPSYVSPVDEGWASNEAGRVRTAGLRAGRNCEWLVIERLSEQSYHPLRDALRSEYGGRLERQLSYPGVTVAQICH